MTAVSIGCFISAPCFLPRASKLEWLQPSIPFASNHSKTSPAVSRQYDLCVLAICATPRDTSSRLRRTGRACHGIRTKKTIHLLLRQQLFLQHDIGNPALLCEGLFRDPGAGLVAQRGDQRRDQPDTVLD